MQHEEGTRSHYRPASEKIRHTFFKAQDVFVTTTIRIPGWFKLVTLPIWLPLVGLILAGIMTSVMSFGLLLFLVYQAKKLFREHQPHAENGVIIETHAEPRD